MEKKEDFVSFIKYYYVLLLLEEWTYIKFGYIKLIRYLEKLKLSSKWPPCLMINEDIL